LLKKVLTTFCLFFTIRVTPGKTNSVREAIIHLPVEVTEELKTPKTMPAEVHQVLKAELSVEEAMAMKTKTA
jgi:hypothetical protein